MTTNIYSQVLTSSVWSDPLYSPWTDALYALRGVGVGVDGPLGADDSVEPQLLCPGLPAFYVGPAPLALAPRVVDTNGNARCSARLRVDALLNH